jgi:hypothetical protein
MVKRLTEVFAYPSSPQIITEAQFDYMPKLLIETARKPWHEIGRSDYWAYLLDLCYVDLQQDLFDYLFPAFLIKWWEGQLSRRGGPSSGETDFYRAIDTGQCLFKMMDDGRRSQIFAWMIDAYIEGVDAWGGSLSTDIGDHYEDEPFNLDGPLGSFSSLGQSVPIINGAIDNLLDVSSLGRAQWWLVFASILAWDKEPCPFLPEYLGPDGCPISLSCRESGISSHGYLDSNLLAFKQKISYSAVKTSLSKSLAYLRNTPHSDWTSSTLAKIKTDETICAERLTRLVLEMSQPDLGLD